MVCTDPKHKGNSTCGLQCDTGYQPSGPTTAKCLWDGDPNFVHKWDIDHSRLTCVESVNVVVGGLADDNEYMASAEVFTPNHVSDCDVAKVGDYPYPVMGAVGGMVGGVGVICGGAMNDYDNCSNIPGDIGARHCQYNIEKPTTKGKMFWPTGIKTAECYIYDIGISKSWKKVAELTVARAYAASVSLPDGSMWIFGGLGKDGPLDSIEILSKDVSTGEWKVKTYHISMRRKLFGHCAVFDPTDKRIVITGGFYDGDYTDKVFQKYCPTT